MLERERVDRLDRAERERLAQEKLTVERERERQRAERYETRLLDALSVSTCTVGVGASLIGAALLLKRAPP